MTRSIHLLAIASSACVFAACSSDPGATTSAASSTSALDPDHRGGDAPEGLLVQGGAKLILWGVTEDDFAIYQDGPNLYSTGLWPYARRQLVAELGTNTPYVLVSGRVAFVFTNQPRIQVVGQSMVGPLVVWTSQSGPKLASNASIFATLGVAASPDGRQVIFNTNVNADGTVGDVVLASSDLSKVTTLVPHASVNYNYSSSGQQCAPFVGFTGQGHDAVPTVAYCDQESSVAFVSSWTSGAKIDLSADSIGFWSGDPSGTDVVLGTNTTPRSVLVNRAGQTTNLEDPTVYSFPFYAEDGTILSQTYTGTGATSELRKLQPGAPPQRLVDLGQGGVYTDAHDGFGFNYVDKRSSPDGRLILYATQRDPNTYLSDMFLTDVSAPGTAIQLQSGTVSSPFNQVYAADSKHVLYGTSFTIDATTGTDLGELFAASLVDNRQISEGSLVWTDYAATGSTVSFNEATVVNTTNVQLSTADLKVLDLAGANAKPAVVARQAYVSYFPAYGHHAVAYSWDRVPEKAGIYVAHVCD